MFVGVVPGSCYGCDDGILVCVLAVGAALDQFVAGPLFTTDGCLKRIVLDVGGPSDQLVNATEDFFDLFICKQRRLPELELGKLHVGVGSFTAVGFCLAELAPFAAVVFAVSVEGKLCGRGQNPIGPLVEFLLRNGESADVGASGLVDGHADGVDVVDAVEQLQRTESVQLHLRVVVSLDQNASAVLVVHDVQRPVCNDDAVAGAEALLDVLGVVEPLFDQDHRVRAGLLGLLDQLHYKGHIPVGTFLHFGIVPSKVFGRVPCFHTESRPELELTESVGVGTFGCEIAAFVVVAFTEPCRRWAVEPPVRRRCREKCVLRHFRAPPHPPPEPCSLPGQPRRASWHRTSGEGHGSER